MKAREQIEKALLKSKMASYKALPYFAITDKAGAYAVHLSRHNEEFLLIASDSKVSVLCKKLHAITADFTRLPVETFQKIHNEKRQLYYDDLPHYEIPYEKCTVDEVIISALVNTGVKFVATRNPDRGKSCYDYSAMILERYTNTWLAPIFIEDHTEALSSSIYRAARNGQLDAKILREFDIDMFELRGNRGSKLAA